MAESYLERVANELAEMALADQKASGDIAIVDQISEVLGASSQNLQEAYMTAVRVRRAEERARKLLAERMANNYAEAPKPQPAPMQGLPKTEAEEPVAEAPAATSAPAADPKEEPKLEVANAAAAPAASATAAAPETPAEPEVQEPVEEVDEEDDALLEMWGAKPKPEPAPTAPAMPRRVKR